MMQEMVMTVFSFYSNTGPHMNTKWPCYFISLTKYSHKTQEIKLKIMLKFYPFCLASKKEYKLPKTLHQSICSDHQIGQSDFPMVKFQNNIFSL